MIDRPLPQFAGVELTADTIRRTREHFAESARRCIEGAESGEMRVNDLPCYVAWKRQCIADSLAGQGDHSFTFLQRAHWLQTGECVPLFAPPRAEKQAEPQAEKSLKMGVR